jgi:hypothetical protein
MFHHFSLRNKPSEPGISNAKLRWLLQRTALLHRQMAELTPLLGEAAVPRRQGRRTTPGGSKHLGSVV